jgi:hypothetical protein
VPIWRVQRAAEPADLCARSVFAIEALTSQRTDSAPAISTASDA